MYARVARYEDADAEAIRRSAADIKERAASGPPEGVPATGVTLLIDPDNGRGLVITLYDTEEDLRKGDAVFNTMTPPEHGMGRRASVEAYEVAIDLRA